MAVSPARTIESFNVSPGRETVPTIRADICDNTLADLLEEPPLGPDQQSRRIDDAETEFRATVADSWELRWWLLGRGPSVQVTGPAALRREIADSRRRAAASYDKS